MTTRELIEEAVSLPVEERARLVDLLLRTLNTPVPDVDRDWLEEARRRLEEFREGKVQAIPGKEVVEGVRRRFGE